jgi:hypothetical protein
MKDVLVRRIRGMCALAALSLFAPNRPAEAADLTEVADAFDEENDNPFDFRITPTFQQRIERGRITREGGCGRSEGGCELSNGERLDRTIYTRELDYRRVVNTLNIDLAVGLYHDLEARIHLPIVIGDQRRLSFANGVNPTNSTVAPDSDQVAGDLNPAFADVYGDYFGTYQFFGVPNDEQERAGFGDMGIGLSWSPFSERRNPHTATVTLAFDYFAPTGTPARATNDGVGRGVHELQFGIAASKRLRTWFDPYFGMRFNLPIPATNGLFESHPNSRTTGPGASFLITSGTEIIMASAADYHYTFDFGMKFGYQLEGRDYSPLFDALAGSSCNGRTAASAGYDERGPDGNPFRPDSTFSQRDAACAWVVQQPANGRTRAGGGALAANTAYSHDGITDIDGFGTIGGHIGLLLQFNRFVQFRFRTDFDWQTPHLLTKASPGRDANNDGVVDLNPTPDAGVAVERNPFYNPTIDAVGRRFRLENSVHISWQLGLRIMF